ncbi:MAG: hypothetical protein IJX90_09510 [Blautia sp.]|nr:hypothetical protein [Blautia sp.]
MRNLSGTEMKENYVKVIRDHGKGLLVFCLLLITVLLPASSTSAASAKKAVWVTKNGQYYYYGQKGNLFKGLHTIGGSKYYFDSKGRQQTGWVKISGSYYYFKQSAKKGGCMAKNTRVNGIRLNKNGKAVLTSGNKDYAACLARANQKLLAITNQSMTKGQKLRTCYNWACACRFAVTETFRSTGRWDVTKKKWVKDRNVPYPVNYANMRFVSLKTYNCYAENCGFAMLAVALGYKNVYAYGSIGHGWAVIGGRYYDPQQGKARGDMDRYYNMDTKKLGPAYGIWSYTPVTSKIRLDTV